MDVDKINNRCIIIGMRCNYIWFIDLSKSTTLCRHDLETNIKTQPTPIQKYNIHTNTHQLNILSIQKHTQTQINLIIGTILFLTVIIGNVVNYK